MPEIPLGIDLEENAIAALSMLRPPGNLVTVHEIAMELKISERKTLGIMTQLKRLGYGLMVDIDLRVVSTSIAGWPKIQADALQLAQ